MVQSTSNRGFAQNEISKIPEELEDLESYLSGWILLKVNSKAKYLIYFFNVRHK